MIAKFVKYFDVINVDPNVELRVKQEATLRPADGARCSLIIRKTWGENYYYDLKFLTLNYLSNEKNFIFWYAQEFVNKFFSINFPLSF